MKKSLSILVAIILVMSLFTGCNKDKKTNTTSKVELTSEYENSTELVGNPNATGELKIAVSPQKTNADSLKVVFELFQELYPNIILKIDSTSFDSKKFWTNLSSRNDIDLFFTPNDINATKAIQAGLIADMSDYFKQDTSFSYEEFNQVVLQGNNPEGKQYLIPLNYYFPLFITTKSMIKQSGLNIDACNDPYSTVEEFSRLTKDYNSSNSECLPLYSFPSSSPSGYDFIDYQNQKITIDSPEFKKYAQTVRTYLYNSFDRDSNKTLSYLRNKQTILYKNFRGLTEIIYAKESLDKDDEMVIFPEHNVRGQIQATAVEHIAVNNKSSNKQTAYAFIKFLLNAKVQAVISEQSALSILPISNSALKLLLNQKMFSETVTINEKQKNSKNQFINEFLELVNQVDGVNDDPKIYELFEEFMLPFYKGTKSYEECVKDAESKIQAYVFG
ncbi:extracellular solute-binding protein [Paludicola sp. MB14-C6]|uniref:ABC transporter substrate-binding protein n=1 Tax=Paludihabitans sp. MB14-C6 TaxID=3070656 RepID=UPI0027DE9C41|nr:extracellular solute-binding protein [Paludicola sp. MB14-C6]WMJ23084.1 extracellular solute-binding protein [Paludicola sp. MB14-C6]